jgi:hypothetical protein
MGSYAYLVTFCCYGSWLPGDPRGTTDRRHNVPGTPRAPPNVPLHVWTARRLPQAPFELDPAARGVVEVAIRDQCARAGWTLHAVHVRTKHLHVVVSGRAPAERMMNQIKARATQHLRKAALIGDETRPWSRHGSIRRLLTGDAVERACHYVVFGQGAPL